MINGGVRGKKLANKKAVRKELVLKIKKNDKKSNVIYCQKGIA